jgi:hypothetical protein
MPTSSSICGVKDEQALPKRWKHIWVSETSFYSIYISVKWIKSKIQWFWFFHQNGQNPVVSNMKNKS